MNEATTGSPFMLYIVWHPEYTHGENVAKFLHDHFGSHRFRYVSGGAQVRVMFRYAVAPGSREPLPIRWSSSDTTAVVVCLDRALAGDSAWVQYVRNVEEQAEERGFGARLIPVTMEEGVSHIGIASQALCWQDWSRPDDGEKEQRLTRELTYAFSRMLRHRLTQLRSANDGQPALGQYLAKVRVFLSHSKHDDYGEVVAQKMRRWLSDNADLAAFLDIIDIPPGISFESVIDYRVGDSVMAAIYTDSYSSREWCRREVVRAKRLHVPMVVVDCLKTVDERSFPYLGNVPSVRMDPETLDSIERVAGCLLDEVFKDFLWKCRVEGLRKAYPLTTFLPRAPELISLASRPAASIGTEWEIVYPGPPLSTQEAQLFADVASDVSIYSLTEWLAEKTI